MATLLAHLRHIVGALMLLVAVAVVAPAPAAAQSGPGGAVTEEKLLQQLQRVEGRVTIPDQKSSILIQPAGRDWRQFQQVTLHWIGGIAIIGVLALLVIYYLARGTIKIGAGRSGRTITRFGAFERGTHWLTAVTFVILGLSGLNITFGKALVLPVVGPEAFATLSLWAKYSHNYLSFPFTLGVILTFLIWVKDNFPSGVDVEWVRQGGGMVGSAHPPAYRFNAGQKIIFWGVVLGGAAMAISGYILMFPFYWTDIAGMQTAQIVHGVVGVLFIAVILAHIYIGTLGMEGAFEAMGTGEVDLNWAKEHHKLWVDEEMSGGAAGARARATPAE